MVYESFKLSLNDDESLTVNTEYSPLNGTFTRMQGNDFSDVIENENVTVEYYDIGLYPSDEKPAPSSSIEHFAEVLAEAIERELEDYTGSGIFDLSSNSISLTDSTEADTIHFTRVSLDKGYYFSPAIEINLEFFGTYHEAEGIFAVDSFKFSTPDEKPIVFYGLENDLNDIKIYEVSFANAAGDTHAQFSNIDPAKTEQTDLKLEGASLNIFESSIIGTVNEIAK